MSDHDFAVVSVEHGNNDFETIDLECVDCQRTVYASDSVDPGLEELTKAAARHRRKPEWIEQSVAKLLMEGW